MLGIIDLYRIIRTIVLHATAEKIVVSILTSIIILILLENTCFAQHRKINTTGGHVPK